MADINGYATYGLDGFGYLAVSQPPIAQARTGGAGSGTFWYQMQGFDAVLATKVTWTVQGQPDFTATTAAALAAIAAAGPASTPLRNVVIVQQWASP
jgi:hypothetical protein